LDNFLGDGLFSGKSEKVEEKLREKKDQSSI
jgi:hypothetical protein